MSIDDHPRVEDGGVIFPQLSLGRRLRRGRPVILNCPIAGEIAEITRDEKTHDLPGAISELLVAVGKPRCNQMQSFRLLRIGNDVVTARDLVPSNRQLFQGPTIKFSKRQTQCSDYTAR